MLRVFVSKDVLTLCLKMNNQTNVFLENDVNAEKNEFH